MPWGSWGGAEGLETECWGTGSIGEALGTLGALGALGGELGVLGNTGGGTGRALGGTVSSVGLWGH